MDFVRREGKKEAFFRHYKQLVSDKKKLRPYRNASKEEKQEKRNN